MNRFKKIFILLFGVMACMQIQAQDKIVNPDITYAVKTIKKKKRQVWPFGWQSSAARS